MAANAIRVNDMTTGHGCFPPQKLSEGSPNVYVNSRPVIRQGDVAQAHMCGMIESAHIGIVKEYYRKCSVFINDRIPARLLDKLEKGYLVETGEECGCDGKIITGAKTVFFDNRNS